MRRGQGERLPIPSADDLGAAVAEGREIAACSGLKQGPQAVLIIALDSGLPCPSGERRPQNPC
jgi:hypothetical protein